MIPGHYVSIYVSLRYGNHQGSHEMGLVSKGLLRKRWDCINELSFWWWSYGSLLQIVMTMIIYCSVAMLSNLYSLSHLLAKTPPREELHDSFFREKYSLEGLRNWPNLAQWVRVRMSKTPKCWFPKLPKLLNNRKSKSNFLQIVNFFRDGRHLLIERGLE